jgi:hypothetical protein
MSKAINIRLDDDLHTALTAKAEACECTVTEIIRLAITAYLATDITAPLPPEGLQEIVPEQLRSTVAQAVYDAPLPKAIIHTSPSGSVGMYSVRCGCGAVYDFDNVPRCHSCRRF